MSFVTPNSPISFYPASALRSRAGNPQVQAGVQPSGIPTLASPPADLVSLNTSFAARIAAEQTYNQQQRARVSQASVNLARTLGLPPERQALVGLAAQYYNAGKDPAANPLWVKSGPLASDEVLQMQQYPLASVNQLIAASATKRSQGLTAEADQLDQAIPIVLTHKYQAAGGGYPAQTIIGPQIPIEAQILGLVDAYYAMTAPRPYRPAPMSPEAALQTIQAESGSKWDPRLVAAFTRKSA